MEMTQAYMIDQENEKEVYEQYKKKKTQEFIKAMESGLGKHLTYKEKIHLEFAFKRGMDLVSKNGTSLSEEVIHEIMKDTSI